ncbi:endonuclease/exonuclease/phosphatase family protein [Pontibacter toksunensis]|uniref:Endonuclease/exonuclease/phosphatase family protein n=1 Tax=Pontibacter toksunensis TaxID=1332631 RepID=A0ABW6BQ67_9BACT
MMKKIFLYLVIFVSVLVIIGTLLSLLYDVPSWYIKILDFARLQFLILAVVCLILFTLLKKGWSVPATALAVGLVSALVLQAFYVLPYTFAGDKTVPPAEPSESTDANTVGILIVNVLMPNRNADALLNIIRDTDPEMVLAMETNKWWVEHLEPLKNDYPYTMLYPLDNTYGMALYSKYPLSKSEVKFLQEPEVPSFHTQVQLPSRELFMFHGVHPVPPVPSKKHPDNIGEKEIALVKVGAIVAENKLPNIVAGDYNDVSWSHTTRLFQSEGNLNNVRLGRGLYNTFNAKSPIQRWPLDHFFVTQQFKLLELERLPAFNSDHFPMFAKLVLVE